MNDNHRQIDFSPQMRTEIKNRSEQILVYAHELPDIEICLPDTTELEKPVSIIREHARDFISQWISIPPLTTLTLDELSDLHHELITHLNSMIGFARLAFFDEHRTILSEKDTRALNEIITEGVEILTQIHKVLFHEKIPVGKR